MDSNELWGISTLQIRLLYLIIAFTFIYILYKYRKSNLYSFVILMFYPGLFAYFGSSVQNIYKILLLIYCLYVCYKRKTFSVITIKEKWIILSFLVFSLALFISVYLNGDKFTITFSQYSRYVIVICTFFLIKKELLEPKFDNVKLKVLIFNILQIQILVSFAKFFIIGVRESLVGTITYTGGAEGTILPVLAFIFLWHCRKGVFSKKDYLLLLGYLFIGYLAEKRAIWFIIPLAFGLFMFYIPKRKNARALIITLALIPLVFYLGVRLNRTLNKENKVWGSFDINYVINYAEIYTFGDKEKQESDIAQGRGGVFLKLSDDFVNKEFNQKDWWGYGFKDMFTTDYAAFDEQGFGINHKGSATGAFQSYITMGYIGILTTFLFSLSMFTQIANRRIRYVIIGIFCWEYFLYTGLIIRTPALMFLLLFVVINLSYPIPDKEARPARIPIKQKVAW